MYSSVGKNEVYKRLGRHTEQANFGPTREKSASYARADKLETNPQNQRSQKLNGKKTASWEKKRQVRPAANVLSIRADDVVRSS